MNLENDSGARNAQAPRTSMLAAHTRVAPTRTVWRRRTGATTLMTPPGPRRPPGTRGADRGPGPRRAVATARTWAPAAGAGRRTRRPGPWTGPGRARSTGRTRRPAAAPAAWAPRPGRRPGGPRRWHGPRRPPRSRTAAAWGRGGG